LPTEGTQMLKNLAAQYTLEPTPTLALFSAILRLWW
jgi:hypothetical protein